MKRHLHLQITCLLDLLKVGRSCKQRQQRVGQPCLLPRAKLLLAACNAKLPAITPNGLNMRMIYTELDFLCDRFEEEITFALALDMQK